MLVPRFPLALACAALVALAGCGDDGGAPSGAPDPASATPATALAYGEALVRPSGEVEEGARTAIRRVARIEDVGAELRRLLEHDNDEEASYARDIEPWLGERVGGFLLVSPGGKPEGAFVAAVRDRDALDDTFARFRDRRDQRPAGSYRGVEYDEDLDDDVYLAALDDLLVAGTLPGLKAAIDASRGDSLADSDRYQDALEPLAEDRLATIYADPRRIGEALDRLDLPAPLRGLRSSPFFDGDPATLTLAARADEIVLELAADLGELLPQVEGEGEVSVGELPGDAWAALATPPLGPLVRAGLESGDLHDEAAAALRAETGLDLDRDVLDALGGLGLFARGTSPLALGGGALLRTTSARAATRLVELLRLVGGAVGETRSVEVAGASGFEVRPEGSPQPVVVVARGKEIAAGFAASSARDLLDPPRRLDDSPAGKAAIESLGEGFVPSLVVVAPPVVELLEALDQLDVAELSEVLPYVRGYRSIAIGTRHDGKRQTVRVVAALREP